LQLFAHELWFFPSPSVGPFLMMEYQISIASLRQFPKPPWPVSTYQTLSLKPRDYLLDSQSTVPLAPN